MAVAIPTEQPTTHRQGDTFAFTLNHSDFAASDGWTQTFIFSPLGGGAAITFSSTNSGGNHLFSVSAANTALWPPGEYTGQSYVSKASERYSVECKPLEILPDIALSDQGDLRSQARKILDFINASWVKVSQKQAVNAVIDGLQIQFRSIDEWIKARDYWKAEVDREEAIDSGKPGRAILARFTCPQ